MLVFLETGDFTKTITVHKAEQDLCMCIRHVHDPRGCS